jgi:hypothetical protein
MNPSGLSRVGRVSKEAIIMNKEHVKGAAHKAKGAVKDAAEIERLRDEGNLIEHEPGPKPSSRD